jgi:hypothetical protein
MTVAAISNKKSWLSSCAPKLKPRSPLLLVPPDKYRLIRAPKDGFV